MHEAVLLVRFRPQGRQVHVLSGTKLLEAAAAADLMLPTPCGGEGLCGKCRVRVVSGAAAPTAAEETHLSAEELAAGWRLACQTLVLQSMEVEVPPALSGPVSDEKILVESAPARVSAADALLWKRYVELPPPQRGDDRPDLLRLEQALGVEPLAADCALLAQLPEQLRNDGFSGTAVVLEERLVDFLPGRRQTEIFVAAVDVGTTTLVAELVGLDGVPRSVAARLNPQTHFGDDVLSRILHVRQDPPSLRRMQESVVAACNEMLEQVCAEAGVSRRRIYLVSIAGNTTMQQLFCGIDPSPLGEAPFVPAMGRGLMCRATELGLNIHPQGMAYVLPIIGGFIGGDTVAGILVAELCQGAELRLFVDIGTNGEIAVWTGSRLLTASTAAGPAFEGARISCGMRACRGAIEKVLFDGRLRLNVIADALPAGLCGSGLIDLAAELLRHGLLDVRGRFATPQQLPPDVPRELAERLINHNGQAAFLLVPAEEAADGRPIVLTQQDVRELQLAVGAIRAGTAVLLRQAGVEAHDLHRVFIGGGFGNFIRRRNAQRIGLLPPKLEHSRIRYLGNTALAGARLTALSRTARQAAEQIARKAVHVDLSGEPEFQRCYAESMLFPEEGP